MTIMRVFLSFLLLFFNSLSFAQSELPQLFLFLGETEQAHFRRLCKILAFVGYKSFIPGGNWSRKKGFTIFRKLRKI